MLSQIPLLMKSSAVSYLILGKGWAGSYVADLLSSQNQSWVATTRNGRDGTIKWSASDSCDVLPQAENILITFPVDVPTIKSIQACFQTSSKFILLGSTRPFNKVAGRNDRHSKIDATDARIIAENYILESNGAVLDLAGLWGRSRLPPNWIDRVASSKEKLCSLESLHLVFSHSFRFTDKTLLESYWRCSVRSVRRDGW